MGEQQRTEASAEKAPEKSVDKRMRRSSLAQSLPRAAAPWGLGWRILVSLLATFHLTAVYVAPWRHLTPNVLPPGYVPVDPEGRPRPDLPPPPRDHIDREPPPLIDAAYRLLTPYMNLVFINHGYDFFAPDPGATHLIRIRAFDAQGMPLRDEEIYPDLAKQRPRLFYHRHMMLAEQALMMGPAALRSYGAYLLRKHGAASVKLEYAVHQLLAPSQVLAGDLLNASFTYRQIDAIEVDASRLEPPRLEATERLPGVSP